MGSFGLVRLSQFAAQRCRELNPFDRPTRDDIF
jgi:hypothetical protein